MSWLTSFFTRSPAVSPQAVAIDAAVNALPRAARNDAWANLITAIGTSRDKSTASEFRLKVVTDIEAKQRWRGDDIAKKVIESKPRDRMRRGFELDLGDKEMSEAVCSMFEDLRLNWFFARAGMFENALGGAALFPVINDARSHEEPINEKGIPKISHFKLFEPRELEPFKYYDEDAAHPKFNQVELWRTRATTLRGGRANKSGLVIHESRLVIFPGIIVGNDDQEGCSPGFGDNMMTLVDTVLSQFGMSWGALVLLIQEFSQGVYRMKGLKSVLDSDRDDLYQKRVINMDIAKSILHALVIDMDDDFKRDTVSLAGIADVFIQMMVRVSAAADHPMTRLFGISPAGLNATGESDLETWDDKVEAWGDEHMPQFERIIRLGLLSHDGPTKGKEPDVWSAKFRPMRQMSEKEQAELRGVVAETDERYINAEVVSREEVAKSRWGGDTWSMEMSIDWGARKRQEMAADPVVPNPDMEPTIEIVDPNIAGSNVGTVPDPTTGTDPKAKPKQPTNGARSPERMNSAE